MALIPLSSSSPFFYEELEVKEPTDWIKNNVIPVLEKEPISYEKLQKKLELFFHENCHKDLHIIADWPEDIEVFCRVLITGPGEKIITPKNISMEIFSCESKSKIPHNARADAEALRDLWNYMMNDNGYK